MMRNRFLVLLATIAAAGLILPACDDVKNSELSAPGRPPVVTMDINPQNPADLRQGGELRLAADQLPDNWNYYELDGPTGDGYKMISTVLPTPWVQTPDGSARVDADFVRSAKVTSVDPQIVTYEINPQATWSNGRRLSWLDFKSQFEALSGRKHDYKVASTTGYEDIAKVQRGANDQEVEVTFKRKFAEWQTIFSPLYPASMYATAQEFNSGWLAAPKVTAGPFKIAKINAADQTVTVERDPHWWGARPRLDKITFKVIDKAALPQAISSGVVDAYNIGSNIDLFKQSEHIPGVTIRQAPATDYSTLCFNGANGRILADQQLRVAVQMGIDVSAVTAAALGEISPNAKALGNHFFLPSSQEYRDHSHIVGYDPSAARARLDALGWKQTGDVRIKNGKELSIRFVIGSGNPLSELVSRNVQDQLRAIGVQINIQKVPPADYFKSYVNVGDFDISTFRWLVTSFPVTNSKGVYSYDPHNVNENYGKIGNATINALFDQATAELDNAKRDALAQQIDEEIWKSGSQLPLFQGAGAVAVRTTVANYGAAGYAGVPFNWLSAGFTR